MGRTNEIEYRKLYTKEEERWLDVALFATSLLSKAAGGSGPETNSEESFRPGV